MPAPIDAEKAAAEAAEATKAEQSYQQPWYSFGQGIRKSASLYQEKDPTERSDTRKFYRGVTVTNPVRALHERRQDPKYAEYMMEAFHQGGLSESDKETFEGDVNALLESPDYKEELKTSLDELQHSLHDIKEHSKGQPVYAQNSGQLDMQNAFQRARTSLRENFCRQVDTFCDTHSAVIQEKTEDGSDFRDEFMASPGNNAAGAPLPSLFEDSLHKYNVPLILKEAGVEMTDPALWDLKTKGVNGSMAGLTPRQQEIITDYVLEHEYTEQLLNPLYQKEKANLETAIDNSQREFQEKHGEMLRWAKIYSMQSSKVQEGAERIKQERQQQERNNFLEELNKKRAAEGHAALVIGGSIEYPADFLIKNDTDALPSFEDCMEALKQPGMEGQSFQLSKRYSEFLGLEQKGGYKVEITPAGGFKLTMDVPAKDAEKSQVVWHAMVNLVDTVWCSSPHIPPEKKKIALSCKTEEYARVMAKAALVRGYKPENIRLKIEVEGKPTPWQIPDDILREANRFKVNEQYERKAHIGEAMDNIPTWDKTKETRTDPEAFSTEVLKPLEEYQSLLVQIHQNGSITLDLSVSAEDRATARQEFNKAIDRLNQIPHGKSYPLLDARSCRDDEIKAIVNKLEGDPDPEKKRPQLLSKIQANVAAARVHLAEMQQQEAADYDASSMSTP